MCTVVTFFLDTV